MGNKITSHILDKYNMPLVICGKSIPKLSNISLNDGTTTMKIKEQTIIATSKTNLDILFLINFII